MVDDFNKFKKGIGRLTTDRYDFEKHVRGEGFKHNAKDVILNPLVNGTGDVQTSLQSIYNWIGTQSNRVDGFITVGDGCDVYNTGTTKTNVQSLDEFLNPVFDDILNNRDVSQNFKRIEKGGMVLIKAGTYLVKRTIKVPPGIILMGEGFGTKIINATNLNLPSDGIPPAGGISVKSPISISRMEFIPATNGNGRVKIQLPNTLDHYGLKNNDTVFISLNPSAPGGNLNGVSFDYPLVISEDTQSSYSFFCGIYSGSTYYDSSTIASLTTTSPIFSIENDLNRASGDAHIDSDMFMFGRETIIYNMVISDNFFEPTVNGESAYRDPQNIYSNIPLIVQKRGSHLTLDSLKLIGKSGTNGRTSKVVSLRDSVASPTPSVLNVSNCFIDGFSAPIDFRGSRGREDILNVVNNKIRSCGDNNSSSNLENKSAITLNDNSCVISGNTFYGKHFTRSFVYLSNAVGNPLANGRANVSVQNNTSTLDLDSPLSNSDFKTFRVNPVFAAAPNKTSDYVSAIVTANALEDTFEVIDSGTEDPFFRYSSNGNGSNVFDIGALSDASNNIININGNTVAKNLRAKEYLKVDNYADIGSYLNVAGNSFLKNTYVTGSISTTQHANIGGILNVEGPTTTKNLSANGNVIVTGYLTSNGNTSIATNPGATLEVSGKSTFIDTIDAYTDALFRRDINVERNANLLHTYVSDINVSQVINLDGYTKKNIQSNLYVDPDPNTWMHFKFDENIGASVFYNTGTASSSIPSANKIIPSGSPTKIYISPAGGLFGNSLWFDAEAPASHSDNGAYVATQDTTANPGSSITVSCWVKLNKYSDAGNTIVAKKRTAINDLSLSDPPIYSFQISQDNDTNTPAGSWIISLYVGASVDATNGGSTSNIKIPLIMQIDAAPYLIPLNEWCLLSFTYSESSGDLKAYINGSLAKSIERVSFLNELFSFASAFGTTLTNKVYGGPVSYGTGPYLIGGSVHDDPISGFIDDVRIENTVRAPTYIQDMYNRARALLGANNLSLDNISRSEMYQVFDSSANYKRNSRFYAENIGNQTILQNAKWNPTTKKWQQENAYLPSSIISTGVGSGNYYSEIFKTTSVGISTKDPQSADWLNSAWDSSAFSLEVGTSLLLDDTDKKINFANLSLGPNDGSPGYGRIELHGNRRRGNTDDQQGGPHIQINDNRSPSAGNILPNSLYAANIPKAFARFTYNTLGAGAPGNRATELAVEVDQVFLVSAFNIEKVEYNSSKMCITVIFKNRVEWATNICSIEYGSGSVQNKYVARVDQPYNKDVTYVTANGTVTYSKVAMDVYVVDGSSGNVVDLAVGTPFFNLVIFGEQN